MRACFIELSILYECHLNQHCLNHHKSNVTETYQSVKMMKILFLNNLDQIQSRLLIRKKKRQDHLPRLLAYKILCQFRRWMLLIMIRQIIQDSKLDQERKYLIKVERIIFKIEMVKQIMSQLNHLLIHWLEIHLKKHLIREVQVEKIYRVKWKWIAPLHILKVKTNCKQRIQKHLKIC